MRLWELLTLDTRQDEDEWSRCVRTIFYYTLTPPLTVLIFVFLSYAVLTLLCLVVDVGLLTLTLPLPLTLSI